MKKTIIIIVGIVTLLIIAGVWIYLFMYGAPKDSSEVFARFGFNGSEVTPTINPTDTTIDVGTESEGDVEQNLRQLTTRPVAGASFTESGIRYVEQGTGHVYNIDLTSGEETLISGTTIPGTRDALFSTDGMYVAITSHESGFKTLVGTISLDSQSGGSLDGLYLPIGATEIQFEGATGTLKYLLKEVNSSSGYSYNIKKGTGTQLFTIPLRDIHVLWGNPVYVYTTPTSEQTGYLYRVEGNNLEYTVSGATGLMARSFGDGLLLTSIENKTIASRAYMHTGEVFDLPVPFITEKCTPNPAQKNIVYCSSPYTFETKGFPDSWYKGAVSYTDILWSVNVTDSESTVLSNFLEESGREIDISKIGTNASGEYIYFINKNDNALWMFDTIL